RSGSEAELEEIRVDYLGRKGRLTEVLSNVGSVRAEQRPVLGQAGNAAKQAIAAAIAERTGALERGRVDALAETEAIDVTFPAPPLKRGHSHVLSQVRRELEIIFERIGYTVEEGPEIETDWYNFEALNLPRGHASRDMQDTFFLDDSEELVLRTHTSPMQIRAMERLKTPPIYAAVPGRTYRRDATDPSHISQFMQVEALAVDEGITVGDLKGTILYFAQSIWGADRRIQIRPSYFPYTEP